MNFGYYTKNGLTHHSKNNSQPSMSIELGQLPQQNRSNGHFSAPSVSTPTLKQNECHAYETESLNKKAQIIEVTTPKRDYLPRQFTFDREGSVIEKVNVDDIGREAIAFFCQILWNGV